MKTKSKQVQFLTLLVCLLMAVPAAFAPSHPVFIDFETGETIDEILGDPGTTPDSIWYGFERWWENIQVAGADTPEEEVELLQDLVEERYAEFHTMIEEGNYEVAEFTIAEIAELEDELVETVEEIEATGDNLDFVHDIEAAALEQENVREMLEQNMENLAAVGEISTEQAESLATALEEEITDVQAAVEEQEEEIIDAIAEEQGITNLEAEFQVEAAEEASGLAEQHQEEVTEDLEEVQQQLDQVEADLIQAVAEGLEVPPAATELIAEAHARLEECQNALADGRYGESFGQLTAGEHLLDNAERFLEGDVSREELIDLVESTQDQRVEDHQQYIDDYEEHVEGWTDEFPEHEDDFEDWYEQGQKAVELANVLSEAYAQQSEQLLADGKTEQEIFEIMSDRFVAEYERVYGETYVPPVFEIDAEGIDPGSVDLRGITDVGSLPADALDSKGGFVEGYAYTDPVTGYKYEFTDEGYTYTTPLGLVYQENFPEGFSFPTAYEKGNEEHSYTTETQEGKVTYNYYATGYDVTLPDGTTETYSYPEGGYDVVGGGFFEHSATGFDFRHGGELNHYDYNPVYDTFIGSDGASYRPPEGTYFHGEVFEYDYEDQDYEYEDEEGETWAYDPETNTWTSPTGETHSPDTYTVAPVGHEGEGEYSTATGEVWSWDGATSTWSNTGGDSYNPYNHNWESGIGRTYEFDQANGQFLDPETGDVARDVVWSGVTWYFDGETNSWTSNTGEVYDAVGGIATPPGGGGFHEEFDDQEWSYNDATGTWTAPGWTFDSATGEWSSPEGESFYDPDGNPTGYYSEDGSFQGWDSAGHEGGFAGTEGGHTGGTEGGSYSGGYTGGTYSGGYTGGYEGGSYSGGGYTGGHTDGGSYSGDGGGYSAPSGGDSGGGGSAPSGGDSGGGGHSGGDGGGGGMGGYAVREPREARELHPVTRWIHKYLGVR